jgi:hypothetical protein
MERTTQELGPWLVTMEWDDTISVAGPSRIVIEPNPGVRRYGHVVRSGITTTVLRAVQPRRPRTGPEMNEAELRATRNELVHRMNEHGTSDERFLAVLARAYVAVAGVERNPAGVLSEMIDRAVSTTKALLGVARQRGLLTEATPHRAGGELTDKSRAILAELDGS